MQAASGQWEVMRKREPIAEVIADPETPAELASRLELLNEARDFSISELGLPDNKSYRSYADLERDYVVWNVIAAPEFSLQPKHWCFPVAGCVSYRGYFSKEQSGQGVGAAEQADGFDVAVWRRCGVLDTGKIQRSNPEHDDAPRTIPGACRACCFMSWRTSVST